MYSFGLFGNGWLILTRMYHVLGEFLDANADVFAFFGSNQQIEGFDVRTRAQ